MTERTTSSARRPRPAFAGALAALLLILVTAPGCPTYEDDLSGTYREVFPVDAVCASAVSGGEAVDPGAIEESCLSDTTTAIAVDLFRYGDFVRAIVRFYERGDTNDLTKTTNDRGQRFEQESRCVWTRPASFDEEARTFDLLVPEIGGEPQKFLRGRIEADDSLSVRLLEVTGSGASEPDITFSDRRLEAFAPRPDSGCEVIDDMLLPVDFEGNGDNVFESGVEYRIRNPVFFLFWAGVREERRGNVVSFVPTNDLGPAQRLGSSFLLDEGRGLSDAVQIVVNPPEDKSLTWSGTTRYAFAHFLAVDDSPEDAEDERFGWADGEPIVASTLLRGAPGDAPENTNGFGKALLFVEGDLRDLDERLKEVITGIDALAERGQTNEHFYVGDMYYYNNTVLRFDLSERLVPPPVQMQVRAEHLTTRKGNLPRLFPY